MTGAILRLSVRRLNLYSGRNIRGTRDALKTGFELGGIKRPTTIQGSIRPDRVSVRMNAQFGCPLALIFLRNRSSTGLLMFVELREGEPTMSLRAFVVVLLMLIVTFAGCSAPPTAEADAARQSIAGASSAGADKYAAASLKEAQTAQAALDAELKAQEGKFIKSYDRARELAVAAKTAADKATTDATSARERAEAEEAKKAKAAAARREKLAKATRVGGQIRPPIKIKDVTPVYPAIAQSARVQGDVVIEATIDEEGKVADARVVKSVPLLDQAALDAVRQWQYQPSLLNGVPTAVVTTVTVRFTRP
jgi:protein TonB